MKIEVKLYSYHDMDLVSLYKSGRIVFPETTKQVLNSYANKEVYKVKLLKVNPKREKKYPDDTYKKYYRYYVLLDETKDAAAIKLLEGITPGCRNNFIKVVLRQYICCEIPSGYSVTGDTQLFKNMTMLFQGGLSDKEIHQTRTTKTINTDKTKKTTKKKNRKTPIKETSKAIYQQTLPENLDNETEDEGFDIDAYLSGAIEQY